MASVAAVLVAGVQCPVCGVCGWLHGQLSATRFLIVPMYLVCAVCLCVDAAPDDCGRTRTESEKQLQDSEHSYVHAWHIYISYISLYLIKANKHKDQGVYYPGPTRGRE